MRSNTLTRVSNNPGAVHLDEFLNSPTQRVDITYTAATGVEYRLSRWLNFGVAYEFEKKDSDADVNDYTQSQGIFKIQANL